MRVVLAEKPSVAAIIASALGGRRSGEWFHAEWQGAPITIAYASGHLYEELAPDELVPTMTWTIPSTLLPVPYRIGLKEKVPKEKSDAGRIKSLIASLKKLIPSATDVILATDSDREGEAIGRSILKGMGYTRPFRRLWLSGGMDAPSVKDAFNKLRPSTSTDGMYQAQQARACADWQSQIITRALTMQARSGLMGGHLGTGDRVSSTVTCGRVQSPTLWIVYDRDDRIVNFVPKAFFKPAIYVTQAGLSAAQYKVAADEDVEDEGLNQAKNIEGFCLKYRPPGGFKYPAVVPGAEWEESMVKPGEYTLRFTDTNMAIAYEKSLAAYLGKPVQLKITRKPSLRHAPKPFSMTTACAHLNKRHKIKTAEAEKAIADLYLKGFVSYPRTEAQEFPLSEFPGARFILEAVAAVPGMMAASNAPCVVNPSAPAPASYTDKKEMPHPALSPTTTVPDLDQLTKHERYAYLAITQRYIEAHYPPAQCERVLVWTTLAGPGLLGEAAPVFGETGSRVIEPGWLAAFDTPFTNSIPPLQEGPVTVSGVTTLKGETAPPAHFTEAELLLAMADAARYAEDKNAASILKGVEGIGTSATRGKVIENLKARGYVDLFKTGSGKNEVERLKPSAKGRDFVRLAPKQMLSVAMTAEWEAELRKMDTLPHAEAFEMRKTFVLRNTAMVEQIVRGVAKAMNDAGIEAAPEHAANNPPTPAQIRYARDIAAAIDKPLPRECETSFTACQTFIQENRVTKSGSTEGSSSSPDGAPTAKQISFANTVATTLKITVPPAALQSVRAMKAFLDTNVPKLPPRDSASSKSSSGSAKSPAPKSKYAGPARR